ncbi:hypothetical protein [Marinobacter sp. UBA2498]|jgi:hypothetical protein|uniref:hypothetical protein n=1 Tax=Marinobacter sp. UBA2498 TaxID=1946813 RepID=UPI0025809EDB|nr:hypothetical protein [Marinobacter sp. UBA2498]|tara:strand:+ start:10063 stop:10470 length:408 start_codon:yes stop_codon:yes gene_type:complete
MALTLSPAHEAARQEAARLPALQVSYARLIASPGEAVVQLFEGAPGTGTLIAELAMPADVVTLDADNVQIQTTAPIEGQATVAGTVNSARILDGAGNWWADATVTDENGGGDIRLQDTALQAGAFARITSAVFQG